MFKKDFSSNFGKEWGAACCLAADWIVSILRSELKNERVFHITGIPEFVGISSVSLHKFIKKQKEKSKAAIESGQFHWFEHQASEDGARFLIVSEIVNDELGSRVCEVRNNKNSCIAIGSSGIDPDKLSKYFHSYERPLEINSTEVCWDLEDLCHDMNLSRVEVFGRFDDRLLILEIHSKNSNAKST